LGFDHFVKIAVGITELEHRGNARPPQNLAHSNSFGDEPLVFVLGIRDCEADTGVVADVVRLFDECKSDGEILRVDSSISSRL